MLSPIEEPDTEDDIIDVEDTSLCRLISPGGKITSGAITAPSGYPIAVLITLLLYPLQ
jgi:hypothetical protein